MGAWFNRQDHDDNREPEVIERERELYRRRWGWTFVMGISVALFGGLLGLAINTKIMLVFMLLGLIFGLVGGWVAGSVDIWPSGDSAGPVIKPSTSVLDLLEEDNDEEET